MCGLTGFWLGEAAPEAELNRLAQDMAQTLESRGPDDCGVFSDGRTGLALGHRRLSILDLSAEGHQPMVSPDGRFVLAYNGEVYNHGELRAELEAQGECFRGGSDTEVVLRAFSRWGVEASLERFNGMFALALWDREQEELVLVRDRLGIKPLYWGQVGGTLFFGSELKSFWPHPAFQPDLDRDALTLFFRHSYIPSPHSIYRGVRKLAAGQLVRLKAPGRGREALWWDAREVALAGLGSVSPLDPSEALDRLESTLGESVRARMIADVPLGAFLSGGIDSSIVCALMQRYGQAPIQTFTIGFDEEGYDESSHARAVAKYLGTDHHELTVTADQAREVIPSICERWDEPFADSSQIPTYLVSRFAREEVTVCLSGDGGDELFGGYPRYHTALRLGRSVGRLPVPLRRLLSGGLDLVPAGVWNTLARRSSRLGKMGLQPGWAAYRAARLSDLMGSAEPGLLYRSLVSHWKEPQDLVLGSREPRTVLGDEPLARRFEDPLERMLLLDTLTYLPDDILCKVDRASMSHGLEARVPLLDHRVFELAWTLPAALRIGAAPGKKLLRELLARHVPRETFERPKMGFGVPIADWIRGPLREWSETLLETRRLEQEGILRAEPVRRRWEEHRDGKRDWGYYLWDVLVFQAWRERWLS